LPKVYKNNAGKSVP